MKRFVSLFLILMLCLSVSAVPVTASDIDANDSIRFLKAIGVVDVDKAIEADKNITRADFAGLVSRIVMQGNEAAGFTAMFKDVTNKHEAFDAINCLGNLGIVSGYDNGYFKPNNSVTQAEAVKMLISALSWDNFMVDRNDYPASYLKAANKFEFFKGINFEQNAALTWEQAALLYSNVLHTNVIYQSSFGTVEQYVQEENVSYLNKYFDIYEAKGIVTDNGITTLSGKTRVGKDQMAIDGKGYYNIGVLSRNLIGNYVVAYYRQTQNEDRGTLVYTAVLEKKNETLKIKATDILGYHAGTYTYRESETDFKEHKAVLQSGFNVLYNGKAPVNLSSFTQAYMKPTYGYVELIDADKTEGYETVKIISRRTVVVSSIDFTNQVIYGMFGETPINLYDDKCYDIFDAEGNAYLLEDLKVWDVLSVVESDDKEYVDIILNRTSFEAKVLEKSDDVYVLTNGEYEASESFKTRYGTSLKPGDYSKFYVDHEGYLVAIDPDYNAKGGLAYLIGLSNNKTALDETCLVKLFTAKGKIVVYPLADKVTLDGTKKDADEVLTSGKLCPVSAGVPDLDNATKQLIAYGINGDDEIDYLDTAYVASPEVGEDENSLNLHGGYNEATRYYTNKTFGGRVMIDEETKVFLIPSDGDENAYSITDYGYFYGDNYTFQAYRMKAGDPVADAIVMTVANTGKPSSNPFNPITLVKEVRKVVNKDGTIVQKLVGLEKSREVTVYTEAEDTLSVSAGDIIRFGTNSNGVINHGNYQLMYDASRGNDAGYTPSTSGTYVGTHFMQYGRAYSLKDGILRMAPVTTSNLSGVNESELYNYRISGFKIYVVMQKNGVYKCLEGDASDLRDYITAGTNCSKLYVYTKNGVPEVLVIYN